MICPNCKGKGEVREKIDWLLGVISGGLTALMQASNWETCRVCKGKGILKEE